METDYKNSLLYQVYSCAKYFDKISEQFFKEVNLGISAIEHMALTVIQNTKDCCQRDLAKIILKDRANTGKLAISLEKKGLIVIKPKTKDNKPVKILSLTKKGEEIISQSYKLIEPLLENLRQEISPEIIEQTKNNLENFKNAVQKIMKSNI